MELLKNLQSSSFLNASTSSLVITSSNIDQVTIKKNNIYIISRLEHSEVVRLQQSQPLKATIKLFK